MSFRVRRFSLQPLFAGVVLAGAMLSGAGCTLAHEPVILTVSGAEGTGPDLEFDMSELEAMPRLTYRTSTIWTEGPVEFEGVPLLEIVRLAGVTGGRLLLSASNDYSVEIPVDQIDAEAPIIAYHLDGAPMSLRNNGPLWVVYPYDHSAIYQTETIYTRSIWQLVRIEVLP